MRTFVNIRAGGKTRLSGVTHSLVLLLLTVVFASEASRIPLAVLGGILLRVGIDIIDWRNLRRIIKLPRPGVVVMLTTLLLTGFVDLITAVAVGIVMTSVLFVSKMASIQMESVRFSFGKGAELDLSETEKQLMEDLGEKIVLFQVEGPLSFATARDITRMMEQTPKNDVLLVDLSKVPFIDSSAAASLEEVTENLTMSGDHVVIYGANQRVLDTLKKTDVYKALGNDQIVSGRQEALLVAQKLITGKVQA